MPISFLCWGPRLHRGGMTIFSKRMIHRVGSIPNARACGIHRVLLQTRCIQSASLTFEQTKSPKAKPETKDLRFGDVFSDHMLTIEWDIESGWSSPKIIPYQNVPLDPAASCLHYALQCFEGLKAYRSVSKKDEVRLFRPDCNMERLSNSLKRLQLPCHDFDRNELLECMRELVRVDSDWVPPGGNGHSLYLRPTVIATNAHLGVSQGTSALLYVISGPVGPMYEGLKPVRLTADTDCVRAWPGGTGHVKVGGNYGATLEASVQANAKGYHQVLWLFGPDDQITEVGTMNVFFVLEQDDETLELVTPPLTRGDILPGVTRRSIVEWFASKGAMKVSERSINMDEVVTAAKAGRLKEAFGAGTAAVVSPIECIQYKGEDIVLPVSPGPVAKQAYQDLNDIQYGVKEGLPGWSVVI